MGFREYFDSLLQYLPTKDDTVYKKVAKAISAVELTRAEIQSAKIKTICKKYKESRNDLLYSCIEDAVVKDKTIFESIKIKDSDYDNNFIHFAEIENCGKYYFRSRASQPIKEKNYAFWFDPQINFENIGNILYSKYGNKIFIEKKNVLTNHYNFDQYSFEPMKMDDKIFEFSSHKKATKYLSEKGTYLFFGPPGTGKSSFVFSDSFKDKKCLIMLAEVFCDLRQSEVDIMLKTFKPDLFLIEEFDKASNKLDSTLLFFERLKSNNITVVLTANKISGFNPAAIRPKRIDRIVQFTFPTKEEIIELINHYSESSNENNIKLAELLTDKKFSHAYVVEFAKKMKDNYEEMEEYIKFLMRIRKSNAKE